MKRTVTTAVSLTIDDEIYRSQGPVDRSRDGRLDVGVVAELRIKAAFSYVEGISGVTVEIIEPSQIDAEVSERLADAGDTAE